MFDNKRVVNFLLKPAGCLLHRMGERKTAAVQGGAGEHSKVPFLAYCLFNCFLCRCIMLAHLISHLIVERLTVFNVSMR